MEREPCASIQTILPTKTPTAGLITRFLSRGTKESSKRLIAAACAAVLCLLAFMLGEALSYQAHKNWSVSGVIATAFALVAGYVAWLAKTIFMKPEPDETKPGTPHEGDQG